MPDLWKRYRLISGARDQPDRHPRQGTRTVVTAGAVAHTKERDTDAVERSIRLRPF
jgi:hypothetical protein